MKLAHQSPEKLLSDALQLQAEAETIDGIIAHLKTLESTLTTGFGVSVSDREIGRYLSSVIQQLCASGDYIRCLGKYMKQTAENASLPTGLAEAFKF